MSDETNVNEGETSSESAETVQTDSTNSTTETAQTDSATTETVDAESDTGKSADQEAGTTDSETVDASESRTAFVKGVRPGEECTCPDGRKGTVHKFDEGLVCIPNADQG